ncbi:hypothetical protein PFTANZ_06703 [Plasmodium falciparum Tanzania (2000708)]|uniref:Surface antigen n=1 Tax=Plasmodium falciparum Tanzania (2000708) TaxID=1036725 RepID=A0A024VVS4_PLAFA|nr:hypothetical protein PFTANZ_06703 [Plasmodium falciparum Tanzania (2000708)]
MPEVGSIGATALYALNAWKTDAIAAATKAAMIEGAAKGTAAGIDAGKKVVFEGLEKLGVSILDNQSLETFFTTISYNDVSNITQAVHTNFMNTCSLGNTSVDFNKPLCTLFFGNELLSEKQISSRDTIKVAVQNMVSNANTAATQASKTTSERVTAAITNQKTSEIAATYMGYQTFFIFFIFFFFNINTYI